MVDAFSKNKILKRLIDPLEVRYGKITPDAKRDAFIEDAVMDLGRFDADIISAAFTKVRQGHSQAYKPSLKSFVDAAKAIYDEQIRLANTCDNGVLTAGQINAVAWAYAGAFQWETPQGIWMREQGCYSLLGMRSYVHREAVKQLGQGWPEPDVTIPADVVDLLMMKSSAAVSAGNHFQKAVGL